MCLQDLKIAKHISTRTIQLPTDDNITFTIRPSAVRYGLAMQMTATDQVVMTGITGALIPIPARSYDGGGGTRYWYTDLSIFPGLNQSSITLISADASNTGDVIEQYYDPELSIVLQEDL